jgi:hypothetical protein
LECCWDDKFFSECLTKLDSLMEADYK